MSASNGEKPKRGPGRPKGKTGKSGYHKQKVLGPPKKLTQLLIKRICRIIKRGSYLETASLACGIDPCTLRKWLKLGNKAIASDSQDKEDLLYAELVYKVHIAHGEAEKRDVERIDDAAAGDWRAAAWKLARRFPEHWSGTKHITHDHEHHHDGQIQHGLSIISVDGLNLPLETRKQILAELRKQQQEEPKKLENQELNGAGGD